jgi:hypothetical protein
MKDTASYILDDTIDISSYSNCGTITIAPGFNGTSMTTGTSTIAPNYTFGNNYNSSLKVTGDAEFEGDIKVKGKNLTEFMDTIEKRLAILQPDPKKLKKFEALQKAYNHYKMLEALCDVEENDE